MTRSRRARTLVSAVSVVAVIGVVLAMPSILSGNRYWLTVLTVLSINILLVSSLRSVTLINEFSLGQVGFACIGAYAYAYLVMHVGLSFWPALILSAMLAAFIALLLAHPFLKVRGIYFAILTLLTAETFRLVAYYWREVTGGTLGLAGIPGPEPMNVFGHEIAFDTVNTYYYLAVGVVIIALLILRHFEHAYVSFQWRSIRDDSTLAGAVGINVIGFKILNFVIAAFMAGLSGALFAAFQHNLSADTSSRFSVTMSIYILVYMVVGGQGRFVGPLIGTAILTFVAEGTRSILSYQPMVIGGIAILVMLFLPAGLVDVPWQIRNWMRRRRKKLQAKAVPGE